MQHFQLCSELLCVEKRRKYRSKTHALKKQMAAQEEPSASVCVKGCPSRNFPKSCPSQSVYVVKVLLYVEGEVEFYLFLLSVEGNRFQLLPRDSAWTVDTQQHWAEYLFYLVCCISRLTSSSSKREDKISSPALFFFKSGRGGIYTVRLV